MSTYDQLSTDHKRQHSLQACFVAVYGPVPVSLVARRKDVGVCGVCRAPMRLVDEEDIPSSTSRRGGNDSR